MIHKAALHVHLLSFCFIKQDKKSKETIEGIVTTKVDEFLSN
jgi:hypothetical protein